MQNSQVGGKFVCGNSEHTYYYNSYDGTRGIFDENGNEIYDLFTNDEKIQFISANDKVLVYSLDNSDELYALNLETKESVLVSDEYYVYGVKSDNNTFAIVIPKSNSTPAKMEYCEYYLAVIGNDGGIDLVNNEIETCQNEEQNDMTYYDYNGYCVVVNDSIEKNTPQIAYVFSNSFSFNCLPYNTYICHEGIVDKIELHDESIQQKKDLLVVLYPSHFSNGSNECYALLQYADCSDKYYVENLYADDLKYSEVYRYDSKNKQYELVYSADKDEQIIGYDAVHDKVYLVYDDEIYRKKLSSGDIEYIMDNDISNNDSNKRGTYYVECYNEKNVYLHA